MARRTLKRPPPPRIRAPTLACALVVQATKEPRREPLPLGAVGLAGLRTIHHPFATSDAHLGDDVRRARVCRDFASISITKKSATILSFCFIQNSFTVGVIYNL